MIDCDNSSSSSFSEISDGRNNETATAAAAEEEFEFSRRLLLNVVAYSVMFAIGTAGNLVVLVAARRQENRSNSGRNNVHFMIFHLAIADLVVCLVVMPLEITWRLCVQWYAGNAACKILMFLRAFGFYLSSTTLVCLSVDRFLAVKHPLAETRPGKMLAAAWLASAALAAPQAVVFRVLRHPEKDSFLQCTSIDFFANGGAAEKAYTGLFLTVVYAVPLLVIVVTYANIKKVISTRKREDESGDGAPGRLRRNYSSGLVSNVSTLSNNFGGGGGGAGSGNNVALRMSIVHVLAFVFCWTPYLIMSAWYLADPEGGVSVVPPEVQDGLFLTAVCNSCLNPVVYGGFYFTCGGGGGGRTRRMRRTNALEMHHHSAAAAVPTQNSIRI